MARTKIGGHTRLRLRLVRGSIRRVRLSYGGYAFRVAVALVAAILAPILTESLQAKGEELASTDRIILAALTFIALLLVEFQWKQAQEEEADRVELSLWDDQSQADQKLTNIRKHFNDIANAERNKVNLFTSFYISALGDLEAEIAESASDNTLPADVRHLDRTRILLQSFDGEDSDIFRAVHYLRDNDFFFGMHSEQYFRRLYAQVTDGQVREVRRILIYDDDKKDEQLGDDRTKRLAAFHKSQLRFDYKLISRSAFEGIMDDYRLPHRPLNPRKDVREYGETEKEKGVYYHDFGVYGRRYMYRAISTKLNDIRGQFSNRKDLIDVYIAFFDACYDCPETHEFAGKAPYVELDDLFVSTKPNVAFPRNFKKVRGKGAAKAHPESKQEADQSDPPASTKHSDVPSERSDDNVSHIR